MAEDRDDENRGFKVTDRRRFDDSGDARPESAEDSERAAEPAAEAEPPGDDAGSAGADPHAHQHQGPAEINFATFAISLSTQALALLGEIPDPSGQTQIDLDGARQLIDILGMLQEKTKGNLEEDEAALLEHALYDLRMKYVERSK